MDLTSLFALIAAWAAVMMLIIALIKFLEDLKPSLNNDIVSTLNTFPNTPNSDLIKKSNRMFLKIFDVIYVTKPDKNFYLWFWIFFSTIFIIIFGLKSQFDNRIIPPLDKLLLLSLILPTITVLYMRLINFRAMMSEKKDYLLMMAQFQGIMQLIVLFISFISEKGGFDFNLVRFFSLEISSNQIYSIIGIFFIGGSLLLLFVYLSYEKFRFLAKISPIRAILSSLIAMFIITLLSLFFNKEIANSFISDFGSIGVTILAYIFLNIFADSISLWETSHILRLASTGSMTKYYTLIVFDILISALIFLVIPWSTGNIHVFFEAITFQGEVPWFGILFWSTFFTSVIFYIFIISTCIIIFSKRMLGCYIRFDKILPIMDEPIKSLGMVAMVFITIIFMALPIIHMISSSIIN